MPDNEHILDEGILTESEQELKKPSLYKVLLHNDDYTTMDFVVEVLQQIFHHPDQDAFRIMLLVHQQGVGVAGVFTYEIAETKVAKVAQMAREQEFPLLCTMEED